MQCRPVLTGFSAGATGLALIVTAGQTVSSLLSVFTYSAGKVTDVTYFNAPTIGGSSITITGMHGISATQMARVGVTACTTTEWQSASSVVCRLPMGVGGASLDSIVTVARQVYTLQNAITYDKYYASNYCSTSPDSTFIFVEGQNFGAYDATLNRQVGDFGCASSEWISDTAAKCTLLPGVVASQVTIEAVKSMAMCSVCQEPTVLDGCIQGISTGNCKECQPCGPGTEREGCFIGGFTRGYCETCTTGTEFLPSERTYKTDIGTADSTCKACTICGGAEQDGTQYESQACTATTDTECADCTPCAEGFRVGCAGSSEGKCQILVGVKEIKATAQARLDDSVEEQPSDDGSLQFITTKATQAQMSGAYSEVGLSIPAAVVIKMGPDAESAELQLSVVEVPDDLKSAASRLRRSEGGSQYGIIGPVVLLTPSETQFSPPITVTMPFDSSKVNRTLNNQRLAIYKWSEAALEWIEVPGSMEIRDGVLATQTTSFSLYTVIASPMTAPKIQVVATPLIDLKDYAELLTATEFVTRETVSANAKGPYKKTKIYILKNTLVTFPVAGESGIFVDFTDLSFEQVDSLSRSKNRILVSDWVTSFRPIRTNFAPAINVTIMFNVDKVAAAGRRQADSGDVRIAVHQWDDANRNWQEVDGTYVTEQGAATCSTGGLGVYAVMSVPLMPIILEPPKEESPLKVMTVVPAVIGGTCLILLCAIISFAIHRRSRGKKEIGKLKSALERRKDTKPDTKPDIDPSVLQLAQQLAAKDREEEKVSDKFQPADDVSALELSEQMAKRIGDADDHVIDPSVLSLAQQLAESESPRISTTGAVGDATSVYGISSVQSKSLGDSGLSQDEMASLLAGLAAAEKIQTGLPVAPAPSDTSSAGAASAKSRRPSKSSKKSRKGSSVAGTDLSAISEGGTLSSAQWAQAPSGTRASSASQGGVTFDPSILDAAASLSQGTQAAAPQQSRYASQASGLSLDALGLSTADTGAAMERSQAGAESMFELNSLWMLSGCPLPTWVLPWKQTPKWALSPCSRLV